jgi:hypothetical protein
VAIKIAPLLDWMTLGAWRRYHSIRAEIVGKAMMAAAKRGTTGAHVYEYDEIMKLART